MLEVKAPAPQPTLPSPFSTPLPPELEIIGTSQLGLKEICLLIGMVQSWELALRPGDATTA